MLCKVFGTVEGWTIDPRQFLTTTVIAPSIMSFDRSDSFINDVSAMYNDVSLNNGLWLDINNLWLDIVHNWLWLDINNLWFCI